MKSLVFVLALLTPLALAGKPEFSGHSFHSIGKRGAPVALESTTRHEAVVGQRVALDLRFALHSAAQNVRVELNAAAGLALDDTLLRFDLGAQDKGSVTLPPVNVTVLEEGRSAVNVTVFMSGPGEERFKSFSVPFSTPGAKAAVAAPKRMKTGANGEMLRVMSARETN